MPVQPLVDLATLDLTKDVVGVPELRKTLKQSGRFALLDGILHHDVEGELIVGYHDVHSGEWWCADHIPGRPLFPGVLMVEASAQISTYDFLHRRPELADAFVGFSGIKQTRFRAPVEPDCRMIFVSKPSRIRATMFVYQVQGYVEDKMVLETEIHGMVVSGG